MIHGARRYNGIEVFAKLKLGGCRKVFASFLRFSAVGIWPAGFFEFGGRGCSLRGPFCGLAVGAGFGLTTSFGAGLLAGSGFEAGPTWVFRSGFLCGCHVFVRGKLWGLRGCFVEIRW